MKNQKLFHNSIQDTVEVIKLTTVMIVILSQINPFNKEERKILNSETIKNNQGEEDEEERDSRVKKHQLENHQS